MSYHVSNHAILRYLERAKGIDVEAIRNEGHERVTDYKILINIIEGRLGVSFGYFRTHILELIGDRENLRSLEVQEGTFTFENDVVVTFLDSSMRNQFRRRHHHRPTPPLD